MASTSSGKHAYSQGHSPSIIKNHMSRTVSTSAAFLVHHLKPTYAILDIGCGPGTISSGFCAYVPQGSVTAVDYSSSVVEQAKSMHPPLQFSNLTFETGDVLSGLKYADGTFDVVYTHQTLIHIPDPVAALREAHRVLKSGGMLAMREADSSDWYPSTSGLELHTECTQKMITSAGAVGFSIGRQLHALATQAGFDRTRMQIGVGSNVDVGDEQRKKAADVFLGRLADEGLRGKMREVGVSEAQFEEMTSALKAWRDCEDGLLMTIQGEVICWK